MFSRSGSEATAKDIQVALKQIIAVLVKEYQPEKITLFGSFFKINHQDTKARRK